MLQRLVSFLWGSNTTTATSTVTNAGRSVGQKRHREEEEEEEEEEEDRSRTFVRGGRGSSGQSPLRHRLRHEASNQLQPTSTPSSARRKSGGGTGGVHEHLTDGTTLRNSNSNKRGLKNPTTAFGRGALTVIMHNQAVSNAWDEPLVASSARAKQNQQNQHNQQQDDLAGQRGLLSDFAAASIAPDQHQQQRKMHCSRNVDDDDDDDAGPQHLVEDTLLCAQLCSNLNKMRLKPFLDFRDEQETEFEFEDAQVIAEYQAIMRSTVREHVAETTARQLGAAWTAFSDLIRACVVDIVRRRAPAPPPGVLKAILSQKPQIIPLPLDQKDRDTIAKLRLVEGLSSTGGGAEAKEVLLPAQGFNIQRYQLSTLLGKAWLNDQVINYYYKLIEGQHQGVTCLGSHFYTKLATGDFDGAARWTRRMNIFESDVVFMVINNGVHWTLCAVLVSSESIAYLDSCGDKGVAVMDNVQLFLQREYERLNTTTTTKSSNVGRSNRLVAQTPPKAWRKYSPCRSVPQQANGYDCGVFACQFGLNIARTKTHAPAMDFTQKDIPFLRQLMLLEITQGRLLVRL